MATFAASRQRGTRTDCRMWCGYRYAAPATKAVTI
jgi:hypothetical protein